MSGIKEIAKAANVKADVVVDIFEAIFQMIRSGETVRVTGFGTFERKSFPGRTVQSPVINDGEPMAFGDTYRMSFKQSNQAKRRLNLNKKKREQKKRERAAAEVRAGKAFSATKLLKKKKRSKKDKS